MSEQKQRYCVREDGDGHSYLIPYDKDLLKLFDELVEDEDGWEDDRWQQFEDMRIDGTHRLTFENPIEE